MKQIFTAIFILLSNFLFAQSTTVVISQVYGGGSNTSATYNADFIELHNKSTVDQSIDGMSLQYLSATGTGKWSGVILLPNATIPAGGYYLVQTNTAGAVGANLPAPDFTAATSVNMSGTNGRVALVNGTDTLTDCPSDASVIDLVGYGTSVCFEGTAAGALSNTTAAIRNIFGCDDTNNNTNDITVGTPNPRNSSTPVFICGVTPIPAILTASSLSSFGSLCVTSGGAEGSFTLSGTNLSTADITIGALNGYSYSLVSGGPYTSTLTIPQPGGNFVAQTIFVKFNPILVQSYAGLIPISGGGATSINVAVSGSGVDASVVTTLSANAITTTTANLRGTLTQGCLPTTQYGFEYSTTNGFTPGTGTSVIATNLSGTSFSSGITGLTVGTTYYYVTFVINSGGTLYGTSQTFTTTAQSTGGSGVVISQVYGGGGSSSGTYNADYVELHNNGTSSQDISGCKIMYGSAAGTFGSSATNIFTFPAGTSVPAGGYLLVATVAGTGLANLPIAPDYTFTLTLSGTNGKVLFGTSALLASTSLAAQPAGSVFDAVGYGTANEFEGTVLAALSATTAALRNNNGCTDVNNNSTDFTIGVPVPRNSASPAFSCGGTATPTLTAGTLNAFGTICVNTITSSNSFTINGANLTAGDITVGPLPGFSFSLTATGTYSSTLNISQTGGALSPTTVFVQFNPTVAQTYDGNIMISGGGATSINVAASGSGVASVTPTFSQVAAICSGGTFALPTTSSNSITGTWSPAINNTATTTYTFTPAAGQCAISTTMTVVVNQTTIPTFTQVAAICSGGSFALPTTSSNSITGTWSPAINNTATTTYTFTPAAGQCAISTTMTVVVNQTTIPTFTQVAAICSGGSFALPTTSTNSITGTWSPAINNTATTTYTFTPTAGQCASAVNMTVTVTPATNPTFTQVAAICSGGTFTLPTISTNSITGTWSPAINNTATTTYTFTPTAGQCATTATMTVTVTTPTVPAFTQVSAICTGGSFTLPTTSNNSITGTWSPAINNTATTTYTFTPTAGQCASTVTMTVTVNNAGVTPTFTQVAAICNGGTFTLPTTSSNSITGTWSPAINTTATTTYTFTPDAGQCAISTTMTVVVNQPTVPTFIQVAAICSGGSFALPTTSTNSITGTWSPAINNTATTTYTFTPTAGQCATAATMTVIVTQPTAPTFTQVSDVCNGGTFTLPTTSTNSITGTWSPAINNTTTTTYTFTPTAGQCATAATMTVIVTLPTVPTFTQVSDVCSGGTFTLPTTSMNSITGTWSPAINNTTTTTYTFTPTAGQCASTATMTVNVTQPTAPTFMQVADVCSGGTFTLPTTSNNSITGSWSPAINTTATTTYTFTPDAGQCATPTTMTVNVITSGSALASTGVSSAITSSGATLAGTVSLTCATATAYGIEYSTTNGFTPGSGTVVNGTNLSANAYTVSLTGLTASTTYYYIAYVTTASGTQYGTQSSFTTSGSTTSGSGVVISQVYGAGGNTGALFNADYVELHNNSNTPQTLTNYSIQYASATATATWSGKSKLPTPLTIPAGGYYLIQMSGTGAGGTALPTPDYVSSPTISMSAKNARVALVSDTATLSACPSGGVVVDLVGYGTTTVCSENTPTDTLSILRAALRKNNGCDDTNNNSADFTIGTPAPRNSASPVFVCGGVASPALVATTLTTFGALCLNTTSSANSFSISGTNLTAGDITVGSLSGYSFSLSATGTYTPTLTIPQTGGTLSSTTVFVQFTPTAVQSYDGNIAVSGGGATAINVAASGSGVTSVTPTFTQVADVCSGGTFTLPTTSNNSITGTWSPAINTTATTTYTFTPDAGQCATPTTMTVNVITSGSASATTGVSSAITSSGATLAGTVSLTCATATAYGIEYSTTNGFTPGSGTVVNGTNLNATAYSVSLTGLTASTTYYYVAFVTTASGTQYGTQSSFTTSGSTTTGPAIVISQVYGGGGNTGASFNADYVELHNRTSTAQSLSGLSVQYSSATGTTTWSGVIALPTASIPAGGYYLVQTTSAGTVGASLPTADFTATTAVNMSGTNGKVALVNGTTALVGCPAAGQYIDMVGYGTANCSETTAMGALSVTTAGIRNNNGCDDTDNNSADFTAGTPSPRNSASAAVVCGSTPTGAVLNASNLPNFGSVIIGSTFAQSFNLAGSNLTGAPGAITITSSNGLFLVSTDNINWSSSVTVPYTSATLASTTIYVQFAPVATGAFTSTISVSGGGANTININASGTGIPIPVNPMLSVATSTIAFGDVCSFNTAGPLPFTITGTNLTADAVVVGLLNGFAYSLSQTGPFTSTLSIPHAPGSFSQMVYVQFTPNAEAIFDGSIGITGGGASAVFVPVTGNGTKSTPDVITGDSTSITTNSAILTGNITATGCTDVTEYGVEVSGVAGFANGSGIRYTASDLSSGLFHTNVTGLVQNTAYYYKAYAKNNGGYSYGNEKLFITSAISSGLQVYSVPFIRGQNVHYSLSGIKPGHYTIKMYNTRGQLSCMHQFIAQSTIIDDQFVLSQTLAAGVYTFEVANPSFRIVKKVMVQ